MPNLFEENKLENALDPFINDENLPRDEIGLPTLESNQLNTPTSNIKEETVSFSQKTKLNNFDDLSSEEEVIPKNLSLQNRKINTTKQIPLDEPLNNQVCVFTINY